MKCKAIALKFEAGEGFEPSSTCTSKRVTFAMVFIPIYAIQLPERPPVRKHRREALAVCYQRTKAGADREKPNPKLPPTGITPVRSYNPKLAVWIIVSERKVHRKRIRRNYFFISPVRDIAYRRISWCFVNFLGRFSYTCDEFRPGGIFFV